MKKISWTSHALISEVLWQNAGNDVEKRKVAALIGRATGWCWIEFLALDDPLQDWVLDTLAPYAKDDEYAPEVVKARLAQEVTE